MGWMMHRHLDGRGDDDIYILILSGQQTDNF